MRTYKSIVILTPLAKILKRIAKLTSLMQSERVATKETK